MTTKPVRPIYECGVNLKGPLQQIDLETKERLINYFVEGNSPRDLAIMLLEQFDCGDLELQIHDMNLQEEQSE